MRPIDADGLPKEAERDKDFRLVIPECRVSRQPTIDPESLRPRWIPVTERLPETDGENAHAHDVLVYIPKRDGCNQHGIYVGKVSHIPPDDGRGNFWGIKTEASDWTVWGWSYFETPVVTHWMPLPEFPKED